MGYTAYIETDKNVPTRKVVFFWGVKSKRLKPEVLDVFEMCCVVDFFEVPLNEKNVYFRC